MGSSSKKKSSKKKSAKISSQPKKMKKSRRNANKKRGHRHDSSSEDSLSPRSASSHSSDSLSDNDSMSSVSMSSSTSDGTYRSRKKGSRLRKNAKSRASRKSKNREDSSRGLKRKRSKKKDIDSKSRKKYRKKKPRRHDSVSASSDSSSCSTCKSSSSSEESGSKRRRIKSTEKQKRRSEFKTETILSEERTHGSPNGSIDCRSRDQSCRVSQNEEAFVGESKSRRLRSVITVAVKPHDVEESQLEKDLLIEEAMHDHDNITSSKTIDASDFRSKRDVPPPLASSDGKMMESSSEEEGFLIDQMRNEFSECRKDHTIQNRKNPFPDDPKNGFENDSDDRFLADASPGENDLEIILRRKALENLKKFRVKHEINVKTKVNELKTDNLDANQISIERNVAVGEGFPELGSSNVSGRAIIDESMKPRFKKDSPRPAVSKKKYSDGEHADKKSDAVNLNAIVVTDAPPLPVDINTIVASDAPPLPEIPSQAFDPDSGSRNLSRKGKISGNESVANQNARILSSDKRPSVNKISETNTTDNKNYSTSPVMTDDHRRTRDVGNPSSDSGAASSAVQRTSGEGQSSNDQKNDAKDGSEWKQKKMSVMRGGEMVEVSYKVYIPQRTPALARRQLKR